MLEEFYQNLYHDFFFKWIILNTKRYYQDHIICQINENEKTSKTISFDLDTICGYVTIWTHNIIEEKIIQKDNQNILFYLHYNINDLALCRLLFQEFYCTLLSYNNDNLYKIAICSHNGLSTSIFVNEINQLIELENLDFCTDSLSIEELFKTYQDYDAIYLAPQIAFKQPSLLMYIKDIPIYQIDPTDFATKDYQGIIESIQHNLSIDKKCYQ